MVLFWVGIGQICPIPTAFSAFERDEKTRSTFLSFFAIIIVFRLFGLTLGQIFRLMFQNRISPLDSCLPILPLLLSAFR